MDSEDTARKLFGALVERFRPYVAAVQLPKMLAWARSPYGMEEKKILLGFWFTPMMALAIAEWKRKKMLLSGLKAAAKEAFKALFNRPRMSEKQIGAASGQWLNESAALFVRGWLETLEASIPDAEDASFDPSALDDAMLPPLEGFDPTAIIMMLCADLEPEDIRAILRSVKASLPPGQLIPAEALALLSFAPPEDPDPLDSFATIEDID
jgi:hypothetical protein